MTTSQISQALSIQQRRIDRTANKVEEVEKVLVELLDSELPENFDVNKELKLAEVKTRIVTAFNLLSSASKLIDLIK